MVDRPSQKLRGLIGALWGLFRGSIGKSDLGSGVSGFLFQLFKFLELQITTCKIHVLEDTDPIFKLSKNLLDGPSGVSGTRLFQTVRNCRCSRC